jgi:hypothetical protein
VLFAEIIAVYCRKPARYINIYEQNADLLLPNLAVCIRVQTIMPSTVDLHIRSFFYNGGYCWKIERKGLCGSGILVIRLGAKHQLRDLEVDGR